MHCVSLLVALCLCWLSSSNRQKRTAPVARRLALGTQLHNDSALSLRWTRIFTTATNAGPSARYDHAMGAANGRLILFGGCCPANNELWLFDVKERVWDEGKTMIVGTQKDMPSPRAGHVLFMAAQYAFVHGGFGGPFGGTQTHLADMWGLELRVLPKRKWVRFEPPPFSPVPQARTNHAAAVVKISDAGFGYDARFSVFVFGGRGPGGRDLSDLWRYDVHDNLWTLIDADTAGAATPAARSGHCLLILGSTLYLHGGQTVDIYGTATQLPDIWSLEVPLGAGDVATARWQRLPATTTAGVAEATMLAPSHPKSSLAYILRFAGFGSGRGLLDGHAWLGNDGRWNPSGNVEPLLQRPLPRMAHTTIQYGPRLYLFGGQCNIDAMKCLHSDLWESSDLFGALGPYPPGTAFTTYSARSWQRVQPQAVQPQTSSRLSSGDLKWPRPRAAFGMASLDALDGALAGPNTILVRNASLVSKLIAGLRVQNKTDSIEYVAHVATLTRYHAKMAETSARAVQAPSLLLFGGVRSRELWQFDLLTAKWKVVVPHTNTDMPTTSGARSLRFTTMHASQWHGCDATYGVQENEVSNRGPRAFGFTFGGFSNRYLDEMWSVDLLHGMGWRQVQKSEGKENHPSPRAGHSMLSVGTRLYLFGGEDYMGPLGDTWIFDTCTARWRVNPDFSGFGTPASRFDHAAAAIRAPKIAGNFEVPNGDLMYVHGGRTSKFVTSDTTVLGDLWWLDLESGGWFHIAIRSWARPPARFGHAMVLDADADGSGHRLFIFGGQSTSGVYLNDMWVFYPQDKSYLQVLPRTKTRPSERAFHELVAFGGAFYLFGGYNRLLAMSRKDRASTGSAAMTNCTSYAMVNCTSEAVNRTNSTANVSFTANSVHLDAAPDGDGYFADLWVFAMPNLTLFENTSHPGHNMTHAEACRCQDSCASAHDGVCDDGGLGSAFRLCALGSDCADCAPNTRNDSKGNVGVLPHCPVPPPPASEGLPLYALVLLVVCGCVLCAFVVARVNYLRRPEESIDDLDGITVLATSPETKKATAAVPAHPISKRNPIITSANANSSPVKLLYPDLGIVSPSKRKKQRQVHAWN